MGKKVVSLDTFNISSDSSSPYFDDSLTIDSDGSVKLYNSNLFGQEGLFIYSSNFMIYNSTLLAQSEDDSISYHDIYLIGNESSAPNVFYNSSLIGNLLTVVGLLDINIDHSKIYSYFYFNHTDKPTNLLLK